jgi:hypothetical protein
MTRTLVDVPVNAASAAEAEAALLAELDKSGRRLVGGPSTVEQDGEPQAFESVAIQQTNAHGRPLRTFLITLTVDRKEA